MRIGLVTPRYGKAVVGGSESMMREAAQGFAGRGYEVEVLTTCAKDHYTWANEYEQGVEEDGGVLVRRFPVLKPSSVTEYVQLATKIDLGEELTPAEELAWADGLFRVPDLYTYLAAMADSYSCILFSPYLFWTTLYGASIAPERTVLIPCLHDEPQARVGLVASLLSNSKGVWFLSEPEHQLAHRLARLSAHHRVIGSGVKVPDHYDPTGFKARHGLTRPFILYAGRREKGKGWEFLLDAFAVAAARYSFPYDLVTIGVGSIQVPEMLRGRVIDLGFLEEEEVPHAFAAADLYVQPSPNESFSRTIMEAWLAGTPVAATDRSAVLTWHCELSGGGLTFHDQSELVQILLLVAEGSKVLTEMAAVGRDYVLENYTWERILDLMEEALYVLGTTNKDA